MRRISPTAFHIARRGTSREINRQIALNLVRTRQPISRADLARLMGVRRGAISRLVEDLIGTQQVFEGAKGESLRGRKPRHLYIETRRRCAMAVDISASQTLIQVTDPLGYSLLDTQEIPTRSRPTPWSPISRGGSSGSSPASRNRHVFRGRCGRCGSRRSRARTPPLCADAGVARRGHPRPARGCDPPARRPRELRQGLRAGPGVGGARTRPRGRLGRLRERLGRRRRRHCHRRPVAARRAQQRGRIRSRGAQHGRPPLQFGQRGCLEATVGMGHGARYLGRDSSWPGSSSRGRTCSHHRQAGARRRGRAPSRRCVKRGDLGRGLATIVKAVEPRRIYMSGGSPRPGISSCRRCRRRCVSSR